MEPLEFALAHLPNASPEVVRQVVALLMTGDLPGGTPAAPPLAEKLKRRSKRSQRIIIRGGPHEVAKAYLAEMGSTGAPLSEIAAVARERAALRHDASDQMMLKVLQKSRTIFHELPNGNWALVRVLRKRSG